jgi:hypothetical protein
LDVPACSAQDRYNQQASLPYLFLPRDGVNKYRLALDSLLSFFAHDQTQCVEHILWLTLRHGLFPPQMLRRFACDVILACMDLTPLPEDTLFRSLVDQIDILAHENDTQTYPGLVSDFYRLYQDVEGVIDHRQFAIIEAMQHLFYGEYLGASLNALLQALEVFLAGIENEVMVPILLGRLRSKLAARSLQSLNAPSPTPMEDPEFDQKLAIL